MDDIRRPQQPQRRDYTAPTPQRQPQTPAHQPVHHQPQHHSPQPAHHQPQHHQAQPIHHQPQHHQPQHQVHHQQPQYRAEPAHHQAHQPAAHHQPAYQQPAQPYQPQPAPPQQPQYQSPSQIAAAHHAAAKAHKPAKAKKSPILKIITIFVALVTAASLLYFGYSLRSSTSGNGISQKIIQQAPFTVYFPSPMPPGYTYMKDTATFQVGQVFFKFSNSANKRVTVNEQPLPNPAPKIDLPGYTVFDSKVGKASVGSNFGISTGEVIAGKTLITLNTSGGVTQDELKTAINNLQVIGLSSDKK